jgi:YegS/Rv2252/BmrU family lipid kinase
MKTTIVVNRGAGTVPDRATLEQALKAAGIDGEIHWCKKGKLERLAREAAKSGAELVIAGGGDGTLSCVAGQLAGSDTALGILPLGTLNHFARDLGIPLDLNEAAKLIASGTTRQVDVAQVNGRVFINNSAIGLYPLIVRERKAQQRHLGLKKTTALALAAVRTFTRFSSRRLTLTANDHKAQVDTPLLFVGNNRYRLEMPDAGSRPRLDGGELFVAVLRRKSRLGFLAASLRALFGHQRPRDIAELKDVRELRVDSSHAAITISLDGETALMEAPLEYRIRPRALRVVAP